MKPTRKIIVLPFFILTFFVFDVTLSKETKCKICETRNLIFKEHEVCTCPEEEFCNKTTGKCDSCGTCYNFWNDVNKKTTGHVTTILDNLITKYEVNLKQLKENLANLTKLSDDQENQIINLNNISRRIDNGLLNISNDVGKLRNNLQKIKTNLENIVIPTDITEVMETLRNVNKNVKETLGNLTEIEHFSNDNKIKSFKTKLKKIHDSINSLADQIPEVGNDYLNLIFETEDNLILIESILLQNSLSNKSQLFLDHLESKLQWVEADLANLVDIINHILRYSTTEDLELRKNASNLRALAQETKSKLQTLIQEQQYFEKLFKLLKTEKDYHEIAAKLEQRLNSVVQKIKEMEDLLKTWNDIKLLNKELTNFQNKLKEFKTETEKINKYELKMKQLLAEESELLETFEKIENVQSVNEMEEEIKNMVKEIEMITQEIISHCQDQVPPSLRRLKVKN